MISLAINWSQKLRYLLSPEEATETRHFSDNMLPLIENDKNKQKTNIKLCFGGNGFEGVKTIRYSIKTLFLVHTRFLSKLMRPVINVINWQGNKVHSKFGQNYRNGIKAMKQLNKNITNRNG